MALDSLGQPLPPTAGQPGGPIEQCAEIAGQASPSKSGFAPGTYFTDKAAYEAERAVDAAANALLPAAQAVSIDEARRAALSDSASQISTPRVDIPGQAPAALSAN